jgi:hypothetical protein
MSEDLHTSWEPEMTIESATYLITHLKNKGAISLRVRALPSG